MQKFYEKKVKELAVKPKNKECFDCGKKGVQGNVNLTHYTFICTRCAGLHRNLSHKANSIGMVNFTKENYEALEAGGNKRAKKHWLAKLPEDFKRPEQNEQKMMEFLKWVYIEQRFVRKEGDPKKPHTKKPKPKAPVRDVEPKSATSDSSVHSQSSELHRIPSQKTGDSQISQTSHSTHSAGSEKDEGGDSDGEGDTHKSSSTGSLDMLTTDFPLSEIEGKQNGHIGSKSEPDLFSDSSTSMLDTPTKIPTKRTPVDALVEHFREVMAEFHLNPQQIKSITAEALTVLAQGGSKPRTTPEVREEGEEGGNPFDDEFDDEPTTTSTPPTTKTLPPITSSLKSSSSSSSTSLFPDLDATPSPPLQLGSTSGYPATSRPYTQTPQSYPTYGQSSYTPSSAPTSTMSMGMSGVIPGSGSYPPPASTYPPPASYPPTGPYSQVSYPPPGVSYNMSISMGGFSPYPQPHPHPTTFAQPQAQQQIPEKPKGPDLFAGLDPFAHS